MSQPFSEYLQINGINFSTLKHMRESPLHYQNAIINQREDSASLIRLRAIHTALLEPELLDTLYPIFPGDRRGTNAYKEFEAAYPGGCILKQSEMDEVYLVRDAVLANSVAAAYLTGGEPELTLTWTDKATGLACKGRIDYKHPKGRIDLKGAGTDPRVLEKVAARNGYHNQSAWYDDGDRVIHGAELPSLLISYETKAPFDVAVFLYKEEAIEIGREQNQALLARVAECKASGIYNGRFTEVQELSLPTYMLDDEEDLTGLGLVGLEQVG